MIAAPSRRTENLFLMPGRRKQQINLHRIISRCSTILACLLCTLFFLTGCKGPHEQGVVYRKGKGLSYSEDQFGNHVPDYSTAGYKNGSAIPEVPVVITLEPQGGDGDDTARIQNAIDELAKQPINPDGLRGAVLLKAGRFQVGGILVVPESGIVLRGEGQFENGTVLHASGTDRRSLIQLTAPEAAPAVRSTTAENAFRYSVASDSSWEIVDEYVPSGQTVVQVTPVRGLGEGDTVILEQRMNQAWVNTLGMDTFPPRPNGEASNPWEPSDFVFQFERRITKIEGGRIYLDAALVNPIFSRFGESRLFKPLLPRRISKSGVENIRLVSAFNSTPGNDDENHAWDGVEIGLAQDCWVKGVTAVHFGQSTVKVRSEAIRITVEDCAYLDPVAKEGYGRRHGFINAGQQGLVQRCYVEDCSYPFFIPERSCGPNVFLDCYAEGEKSVIGPWRFWAMGTLWDNTYGQVLMARNRGYDGAGWGWSGINQLFWNCTAFDWICVQSPINGWNWAIGCQGRRIPGPFQGLTGHFSSHGDSRNPRSLFMEQLKARKGAQSTEGVFAKNQETGTVYIHVKDTLSEN